MAAGIFILFSVRDDGGIKKLAAYVVLEINDDVLAIVVGENESSNTGSAFLIVQRIEAFRIS